MTTETPGAMVRAIVVAFGMAMLPSCALLSPAKIETQRFMLSELPPDLLGSRGCTAAATLLVFPPQARPLYDTTQMAYMTQAHQVGYFSRNEWGETPSQMLLPLLARALDRTHCFAAVATPPYPYAYRYALRTEILALMQDFTSQPATLQLSLRVQLSDDAANRVIASREMTASEPLQDRTPEAGVQAANKATAKVLQEVVKLVVGAASSSGSRP